MKIVIDTNILISALIKDSVTRNIIIESQQEFYYPESSLDELKKYKDYVLEKSEMNEIDYEQLLGTLMDYVRLIKDSKIEPRIPEADVEIGKVDKKDVIFIASALACNAPIWSDDKHFKKQNKIRILTTKEMLESLKDNAEKIS